MASLKIQVLGRGLIPRGLGIAPRKEPFPADLTLIQTILKTPGLKVRMVHPETGQFMNVTSGTLQRLWDKYSGKTVVKPTRAVTPVPTPVPEPNLAPSIPPEVKQPEEQKEEPKPPIPPAAAEIVKGAVDTAANEVFKPTTEEKKENGTTVKPYNPDEKKKK